MSVDEILADFTKYLQNGTPSWGPAFNEKEIETLQKTFAAHAKSEKCMSPSYICCRDSGRKHLC